MTNDDNSKIIMTNDYNNNYINDESDDKWL